MTRLATGSLLFPPLDWWSTTRVSWRNGFASTGDGADRLSELRSGRHLSDAENQDLQDNILQTFPRDRTWEIMASHDDAEACAFAAEIRAFMQDHGFALAGRGVVKTIFDDVPRALRLENRPDRYRLIVGTHPRQPRVAARNPSPTMSAGLAEAVRVLNGRMLSMFKPRSLPPQ
jgi:hypothetical protein